MKKIVLSLAAIVLAAGAYAKDSTKIRKSPEEIANKRADKLKTELSLSDDQRSRVYAAMVENINKSRAIKEKYKGSGDKKAMRSEMKSVHDSFDASMKSILTADQYNKWQDVKARQKEKHKQKKGNGKKSKASAR